MNKIALVTVVVAGSFFTTPLFSASFFNKLMDSKPSVHKSIKAHVKKEGQNYADFSGNWTGICTSGQGEFLSFISLENDDTKIVIFDETLKIGGLHTRSTSDNEGSDIGHTALEWSEDMSTLTIKEVEVSRVHSPYPHNTPGPVYTFSSQFAFSLNNGQLVMEGRALNLKDMEQVSEWRYSCMFSKDAD